MRRFVLAFLIVMIFTSPVYAWLQSGWHTVKEIRIIHKSDNRLNGLNGHVLLVALNEKENRWYGLFSKDAKEIAMFESVLLTAISTGREVRIRHSVNLKLPGNLDEKPLIMYRVQIR